jgi:hypothetical protein
MKYSICVQGVWIGLVIASCGLLANPTSASLIGWDIGQTSPDFTANYLAAVDGSTQMTTWYEELNTDADFYVISLCAMWCNPCQLFASDSGLLESQFAAAGIHVELYDWIFEDPNFQEPDSGDAQLWIDHFWTSNPENVWFGGDIPVSSTSSVVVDILTTYGSNAIPNILILDRNLTVQHHFEGYDPERLRNAILSTVVPEPSTMTVWLLASIVGGLLTGRGSKLVRR